MGPTCYIYTLHASNDPECRPRYVGLTRDPKRREYEHNTGRERGRKGIWGRKVLTENGIIVMTVVFTFVLEDTLGRAIIEADWIEQYRKDYPDLLNDMGGGEGVAECSNHYKEKLSKIVKKVWENPEYREKCKNKTYYSDPAYRAKLSAAKKLSCANPEFRDKMVEVSKRRLSNPKHRAIHKEATAVAFRKPEYTAKRSELAKLQWKRPEHRAKFLATRAKRIYKKKVKIA